MSRKRCKGTECNFLASSDGWCKHHRPTHKKEKKLWRIRDNFHPTTKIGENEARPQEFKFRNGRFGISQRGK